MLQLGFFSSPSRALARARSMREVLGEHGVDMRIGLHTGEVELRDDQVSGIGVHIGARANSLAAPGEILVTKPCASS